MEDKFVSPCPLPTERQREVAIVLAEECAEVQQRTTKLLRFGVYEIQPGQPYSNSQRLGHEIGDLLETIDLAVKSGIVDVNSIVEGRINKRKQFQKFLQSQEE